MLEELTKEHYAQVIPLFLSFSDHTPAAMLGFQQKKKEKEGEQICNLGSYASDIRKALFLKFINWHQTATA